jgi:YesN/AraC family two-component response regulator
MRRNSEQYEATCLLPELLKEQDRELHFHSYLEIYCVVKGNAFVAVCGDNRLLTQGQMVIVSPFENHSCEAVREAEIIVVRVAKEYLGQFTALYPDKKLPRWLTNAETNRGIYEYIQKNFSQVSEEDLLQKTGIVCQLISMITKDYALVEQKETSARDQLLIAEIVQYIYDHCNEKLTLEVLSKQFYLSPTFLSKKLRKQICVDLRAFVNDIRVCKAVRMMDAPEGRSRKIEDIAFACGFSSMSTFYRCYKRNYSFRKAQVADEIPQE